MPWTDQAWLRMALDALRATFGNDPHLKRDMIQFLLDEGFWDKETLKSWEAAMARFNDCLNPNKAQFFKFGEVWALMKRFGRHQLFLAMAEDLGYDPPRLKPTEERRQQLLERIATAYESCERSVGGAQAELQRLASPEAQRSGGGPINAGKVHFSLDADAELPPAAREGCI